MKVLVIEDADILRQNLVEGLVDSGYEVDSAADGEAGYLAASEAKYDLIILDIMLPKLNGFEVLERLRLAGNTTLVLLLTARDAVSDRIKGLRFGADDYLVKPFDFEELLARMEALLRRRLNVIDQQFKLGELVINFDRKEVTVSGKRITLPLREYTLLEHLVLNRNKVVSHSEIETKIYDDLIEPMSNVVASAISSLRKKIDLDKNESLIVTKRGHGYQLRHIDKTI